MSNFGAVDLEAAMSLQKALEASSSLGIASIGTTAYGIAALTPEDLSPNVVSLTARLTNFTTYNMIPKSKTTAPVYQYPILRDLGSTVGSFASETATPQNLDSAYERATATVKNIVFTKSLTVKATAVETFAPDIVTREVNNGIILAHEIANDALIWGDSNINPLKYDGILSLHRKNSEFASSFTSYMDSEVVVDLRGKKLTPAAIEQAAETIFNRKYVSNTFLSAAASITSFKDGFNDSKNVQNFSGTNYDGVFRNNFTGFESQFGKINVKSDVYFNKAGGRYVGGGTVPSAAVGTPTQPVPDGTNPAVVATDGLTKFTDAAGTYFYGVAAVNNNGESNLVQLGAGVITVTSTQAVDLKFTAGVGGVATTGYVIYRSEKNPTGTIGQTKLYPLFSVSVAELANGFDGGAAGIIRDRCRFIANTQEGMLFNDSPEFWEMKELTPITKTNLPQNFQIIPMMFQYFCVPVMYMPGRAVRFVNIGKA